jgi:hypothetical protein
VRKTRKTRVRRKRRQGKQGLRFGPSAKPRHELLAGRTGKVHAKKLQSRR